MKLDVPVGTLLAAVLCALAMGAAPIRSQPAAAEAADSGEIDVAQLFASTCGFCHSDGGRAAGKGPQLMNSSRSDDFIRNRIKNGKEGAMPAFSAVFSDAQIDDIIKYIRSLKPREG